MPNYGEKIAYWYLRLNGFFPLENFVVHRSQNVNYPSDIDVIAVRFPFVYEEIGGQPDDWDETLFDLFDPTLPIGLLCEVKTGGFDIRRLFQPQNILYAIGRFGFTKDHNKLGLLVQQMAYTLEPGQFQIAKILFSNKDQVESDRFFHFSLSHIRSFLQARIRKYPQEKFQDRMRFNSDLIQDLIDTTSIKRDADFDK
jgi:hypothetical protein